MSKFCMGCMEQLEDHINICPHCGYIEGSAAAQALHMQPGSILRERYIVGTSLGFGGFGVTYIAWDALLEQKVAIKEYLPSEFSTRMPGVTQITVYTGDKSKQFYDGLDRFVDEAKRLAKLQDVDGIVHIYDCFKENNTAYIVMEYLEGETLAQILKKEKRYTPDEAVAMLLPVIDSLAKVHEHGIIHRDIAPDNIFVTKDGTMKVIDFGAARYATTSHSRSLTVIIKPGYSPEEQYRSKSDQGSHTDVYALAATLYKMITGKTPPDALERRAFFENKKKDILKPLSVYCTEIDDNQENAILNAMNVRIEDRTPTMAAFKEELTSTAPVKRIVGKIRKIDLLRWPLWAKITMPIAACLILTFGVLFGTGVIKFESNLQSDVVIPDGMTRVPSVVNNTLESADTRLTEAVLLYMISGKEYSDDIPADYILTQDISAGSIVVQNSTLNIIVSGGTQMITTPNVLNLNVDEAVKQLEELGFSVKTNFKYDNVIAKDSVISQSLEANGETAVGTEITLVVSSGVDPSTQIKEEKVTIPNFVGKSYQNAVDEATKLGLTLSIEEKKYSNTYAENVIISQNITAGSSGKTGDTIKLVVSLGKETIKLSDYQYKTESEAKTSLEKLGLKVSTTYQTSNSVSVGHVISQSPAANTELEPGDTVNLVVSKGSGTFSMPNVVGMSESNAKSTLTSNGLTVTVTYEYSNSVKSGNVIKQSVAANTQVSKGSAVVITVSSGAQTFVVPNVTGQTATNAQNTLTNSGFAVSIVETYSDTVANGKVVSQTPAAGTSLTKGANVTITVSKGANVVESISIKTKSNTTSYYVGDTLNTNGLTLNAVYSDGTSKTISSGFTCNPTSLSTAGTKTITVTYSGKSATFNVSVQEITLSSITVKSYPAKTSYYVGETLDTSGLTLTAQYNDGSSKTISSGFTCNPASLKTVGINSITVSYEGKTTTFNVSVQEISLVAIGIKSYPTKTSYFVGETLNTSGLSLTAIYSDGSSKTISSGFTCNPTSLTSAGTKTITVSYGGKTATFTVSVKEVTLSSIAVKSYPSKTSYYVGETLNTSGLTLSANYNDGSSKTISSGFTCTPTSLNSAGTKTITVFYGGKTTSFTLNVKEAVPEEISLSGVSFSELRLNEIALIPDSITLSDDISITLGGNGGGIADLILPNIEVCANVSYGMNDYFNFSASVLPTSVSGNNITVSSSDPSIVKATIISVEGNTVQIQLTGLAPGKATITVSSKTQASISKSFTIHCCANNSISWSVSGDNEITLSNRIIDQPILGGKNYGKAYEYKSVSYPTDRSSQATITATIANGKRDTCNVKITKAEVTLTSISVKSNPTKTSYYVGETLDTSGLTLSAFYSDGSSKTISSGFTCSPTSLHSAGTKTITVSYSGKSTTFTISIQENKISVSDILLSCYEATLIRDVVSVELSQSSITIDRKNGNSSFPEITSIRNDAQFTFTATVIPANVSNTSIVATSSNTSIATVSVTQSGNISSITVVGKKAGEATITITSSADSSISKTFKVIVRNGIVSCSSSDTSIIDVSEWYVGSPDSYKHDVTNITIVSKDDSDGRAYAYVYYNSKLMATCFVLIVSTSTALITGN